LKDLTQNDADRAHDIDFRTPWQKKRLTRKRLIYQEITNRCHVTVLYFLLILYMFQTHSVSIIRRSIKLTAYATSGTVTVSCGRPSSWLSQEKDSFRQQIGLIVKKEINEMLHLVLTLGHFEK
jgi:hypothetical protein